jgi:hypothetical protein
MGMLSDESLDIKYGTEKMNYSQLATKCEQRCEIGTTYKSSDSHYRNR